jgi:hypothetical protein
MSSEDAQEHGSRVLADRACIVRELAQAVRQMSHDVLNGVGVPLGVLELLREHPGLGQVERDQIDLAIARLTTLVAEIRTRHAQVRRLDLAEESPHQLDRPGPSG